MNDTNEENRITHSVQGEPLSPGAAEAVNEMAGNLAEEQAAPVTGDVEEGADEEADVA